MESRSEVLGSRSESHWKYGKIALKTIGNTEKSIMKMGQNLDPQLNELNEFRL